ncbi:nodulation protein NfeD [Bacillus aerolatus]|uniref:Nodulation protein NfeD n=1 Tax=Bacillus aerolatus TaxID=2653354 RepID=A0A6I1FR46_9BACI|nr:nodulation protein NfeD [Bacillus aerolatus]KAB7709212.1 nodulation protein NfeD [Bacillus aerolatus]
MGLGMPAVTQAKEPLVYVVPVHNEVEKGLYAFMKRSFKEAQEHGAQLIVLDIHTPGGAVDAAGEIGKLMDETNIRTVAFINDRALSAGAFISLHADAIYMVPNAQMGAAAIIDQQGNMADKKAQSYWRSAMKSAAETSGLDPKYAIAMADPDVNIPEYNAGKGELLTFSSKEALETGYSKATVSRLDEVLQLEKAEGAAVVELKESWAEKVARFVTNPIVVPILLSLASLGLILELYSPGFGLPGSIGLSSLLLFFYGHLVAGLAGYESVLLFIVGAILIVAELFLPGGIAGILGIAAVTGSILLAGDDVRWMGLSLIIAMAVAITAMILMVKVLGKKMKFFKKIILTDSTNSESGYVSNVNRTELLGKIGITKTPFRPAGTVVIDGERIDAVTEGGFLGAEKEVKVVKVEGARIVVRELEE